LAEYEAAKRPAPAGSHRARTHGLAKEAAYDANAARVQELNWLVGKKAMKDDWRIIAAHENIRRDNRAARFVS
jgi:hypothetical protein